MAKISDSKIKDWLENFRKKINAKYKPQKFILFGSRARGDALLESDIDILIVSDKFAGVAWPRRLMDVAELWRGLVAIEPICYTPEEFEKKKKQIGIVQQAVKEGIEIK